MGSPLGDGADDLALSDGSRLAQPGSSAFRRQVEMITGSCWRTGNQIDVLHNGDEIFPSMLRAIRGATHSVNFATYVYWAGDIGREFAEACAERARAGVTVRVLLDAVGAQPMDSELLDEMTGAGCDVVWFRPPTKTGFGSNHRTHRKLLVVDGSVGFSGGVGIADEWTGDAQDPDHWRDTHVRVTGPVVRDLLGAYQEHWLETQRELLPVSDVPELEPAGSVTACCLRSSPSLAPTVARTALQALVAGARERVDLTTAYFAPGPGLRRDLVDAASRGVAVRILVPGPHIDKRVVREVGRNSYAELVAGGVQVFEYQRTMLHAKVIAVDGAVSTCGSMNLDPRSFALNDECNLLFDDRSVTGVLHDRFERDLGEARPIDEPRARNAASRIRGTVAGLVRRQL